MVATPAHTRKSLLLSIAVLALAGAVTLAALTRPQTSDGFTWVEEDCAEAYNCRFEYAPAQLRKPFVLAVDYQPNGDHYRVSFERLGIEISFVTGGVASRLGHERGYRPHSASKTVTAIVKRRPGALTVVQGPKIILSVPADKVRGGRLGYGGELGKDREDELAYQPVGEVFMTDDFMREAGSGGDWKQRSGRWLSNSVSKLGSRSSMSSNPFCLINKSEDSSLRTAGHWFWDTYEVSASVRADGSGWVGLCAYYRDDDNYLLFRWNALGESSPGVKQLVQVLDGKRTVLAREDGGYHPKQWYRLAFKATDKYVAGYVDGREAIRARSGCFGGGEIGLYAEGIPLTYVDDVAVRTCLDAYDDFTRPGGTDWETVAGTWRCEEGKLLAKTPGDGKPAIATTGNREWRGYSASIGTSGVGAGPVGIAVNVQDASNFVALQAADAQKRGQVMLSLSVVENGRTKASEKRAVQGAVSGAHSLRLTTDNGYLSGEWDGRRAVEMVDLTHRSGKVALLHAQKEPVAFDDLRVEFPSAAEAIEPPPVAESMVTDHLMVDWSSPQGAWRRPGAGGVWWHRGTFFDDVSLSLPLARARSQALDVILAGDDANPAGGYHVALDGNGGCRLSRGGTQVSSASLPEEGDTLTLARRGAVVTATVDGEDPLLQMVDGAPLPGRLLGVRLGSGGATEFESLEVSSRNMLDYTFTKAPVDWHVQRGFWGTWNRWNCKKDWSFFGAPKDGPDCVPTIWNKHAFRGDVVLEMYAGLRMDVTPQYDGYSDPSDLNCTLFGDGHNLNSGYSFVYAGWHNTKSALFRRDEEKASNPHARFVNPVCRNPAFHRHWFYIRAEKIGTHVRFSVDDRVVAEFEDNDPLDEGRLAIWSFNNGIMVARARVWFQEQVGGEPFPVPPTQPKLRTPSPQRGDGLKCTFERDLGTFNTKELTDPAIITRDPSTHSGGRYSLKATNPTSGGPFSCRVTSDRLDLRRAPHLSFDYRFDPKVKVNLYLKPRGRKTYHAIVLSAPDQPRAKVTVVGTVANFRADGEWHHAEYDVLGALEQVYGENRCPPLESVTLASPAGAYVRCGIGGNPWGATYNLDNFTLGPYPRRASRGR